MPPSASMPDPRAVLEHLDWVRKLARSLVEDPNVADDLVQETWIAFSRHPPRTRNLKAWLAEVARNAARQFQRRESRRSRQEPGAARAEAVPSSLELLAKVSTERRMVEIVLALDEPYRQTILLRYFEDLSPTKIAERTGVPLATVRTRLRRALEILRERLDRAHGGDGRAWLAALAPLVPEAATLSSAATGILFMSTKTITLGVLSIALLALGVFWVRSGTRDRDGEAIEVVSAGAERDPGASSEGAPPVEAASPDEQTPASESTERKGAPVDGIRLVVVDHATGNPIPDAEVWYGVPEWGMWEADETDRETNMRENGRRASSDLEGGVLLTGISERGAAVARSGDLYGETYVGPDWEQPVRLALLPDRTLTIRVTDANGTPMEGVPVGIRIHRQDRSHHPRWQVRTAGSDGTAVCNHLYQRLPELLEDGAWGSAALDTTVREPVEVDFDPRGPPSEPIVLLLGATGRIVVLLEGPEGTAMPDGWVMATPILTGENVERRTARGPRHDVYSRQGKAVFSHVELGLELELEHSPWEFRPIEVVRLGPTTPGEEIVVTMQFADRVPLVTCIVTNEAGEPMTGSNVAGEVVVELAGGEQGTVDIWTQTDGEGRFREAVNLEGAVGRPCTIHLRTGVGQAQVLTADIVRSEPLRAGTNDLGVVIVGSPPVVLSGTMRNQRGDPLYWATVDVARKEFYGELDSQWNWSWIDNLRATTNERGEFTSTGTLDAGVYAYKASANGYARTDFVPFQPGTRGVEIVLLGSGKLEGSVILPEGVSGSEIFLDLRPPGDAWNPRYFGQLGRRLMPQGGFLVEGLDASVVDAYLYLDADVPPLLVAPSVEIRPGETTRDPRLQDVDLRERLFTLDVEIATTTGEPIPAALISAWPAGDPAAIPRRVVTTDGAVALICPWPVVDVEVFAPGFRTQHVGGVRSAKRVVLEPGIPVRVRLPAHLELPAAPRQLELVLVEESLYRASGEQGVYAEGGERRGQLSSWFNLQSSPFDQTREIVLRMPGERSYQVCWSLAEQSLDRSRRDPLRPHEGQELVRIAESDAERTLELSPDPKDLERASEQ